MIDIYREAFLSQDLGRAAAVSVATLAVALIVLNVAQLRLIRRERSGDVTSCVETPVSTSPAAALAVLFLLPMVWTALLVGERPAGRGAADRAAGVRRWNYDGGSPTTASGSAPTCSTRIVAGGRAVTVTVVTHARRLCHGPAPFPGATCSSWSRWPS